MKKYTNSTSVDNQIFDIHIHFGEFAESFFSPEYVNNILKTCGVNKFSAMLFPNTLSLNTDKDVWLNLKMYEQNSDVDLVLVVSPALLKKDENLNILNSAPYKMIKLHGALHNWHPNGKAIRQVFSIAQKRNLPIMLHTGGRERSNAGSYLKICNDFQDTKVILAHSRPFDETISAMKRCPNVWADTSFLSIENIKLFQKNELIERVLFGTDFPIAPLFSDEKNLQKWYENNISEMITGLGLKSFVTISSTNYINFFN